MTSNSTYEIKFKAKTIQLALFMKSTPFVSSPIKFANEFIEKINFLNVSPTVLPIPNDAAQDIPRIILKSADNRDSCSISMSRLDLILTLDGLEFGDIDEVVMPKTNQILEFLSVHNVDINRVGVILTLESEDIETVTGSEYIRNNFIKDNKLSSPKELSIRFINGTSIHSIDSNIVLSVGQKGSGIDLNEKVVMFQLDINTSPELRETKIFSLAESKDFISGALGKIVSIIKQFPNI